MRAVLLCLCLSLFACESKPAAAKPVSFRRDIEPVFATTCASANGCHGDKPNRDVDMDLRAGHSYGDLVGVASETRSGAYRVQPGDPAASFLLAKLSGDLGIKEGKPMPLDPETLATPERSPLPDRFLRDVLLPWIRAGAPDN